LLSIEINNNEKYILNIPVAFLLVSYPGTATNQQTGTTRHIHLCYAPRGTYEQTRQLSKVRNETGEEGELGELACLHDFNH